MHKALSAVLIVFHALLLSHVLRAQEWEERLPEDKAVEFYLISPLRGEAKLEVAPELRAELIAKLNLLGKLENRRLRRRTLGYDRVPTRLTPFHSWELCCRIPGQEKPTKGFLMRGRTWVGGFTENEFNAARYFTNLPDALNKLAIPDADDADCLTGYTEHREDAWPDAGERDEAWELPENLSPEDDIVFYVRDRYEEESAEVEIRPLPELRAEFIAKLNKLGFLDKRCEYEYGKKPGYDLALYCRTPEMKYCTGFALRGGTWVGGDSDNEFNAARYFSADDWARVNAAFADEKYGTPHSKRGSEAYRDKTEDTWLEPTLDTPRMKRGSEHVYTMANFLPPEQPTVTSKLGKGSVTLRPRPEKQEALRARLMCLRRLDAEAKHFSTRAFHVPVCQTYALFYRAEEYARDTEVFMWDTHLGGGFCGYWFDAAHFIYPDSWAELRSKLRCEYDKVGYTTPFDPSLPTPELPPAPEIIKDKPQALSADEPITFYMATSTYDEQPRGHVIVELVPELRAEFIRKINRLGKLENRFWEQARAHGGWVHVHPAPTLSYMLFCRTANTIFNNGFELICRTWIGGLNIERYITPRSWQELQAKLRTMDDEATDAEETPPEEEDGSPAGFLSMSFHGSEGGDPTAWREWVKSTASISLVQKYNIYFVVSGSSESGADQEEEAEPEDEDELYRRITHTLSAEDAAYILHHLPTAEPFTSSAPPEKPKTRKGRHVEKLLLINFVDTDGDSIIAQNWADFYPESKKSQAPGGFALPDAVYAEIERRLHATLEKGEGQVTAE